MALELLLSDEGPRIALVDWDLPRLDGRELCRLLHDYAGERRIYLVLLASQASGGCIDAGLEAGAHDFLAQPVTGEELRARVEHTQRVVELPWGREVALRTSAPASGTRHLPEVDDAGTILRRLHEEVERARRDHAPLSIALLHFEGWAGCAGAEAARPAPARSRRQRAGCGAHSGRTTGWGGPAATSSSRAIPKAGSADIETVLDRLRDALQSAPVAVRGAEHRLTAAIGGATGQDLSAGELLAVARSALDTALCEAPGCVVLGLRLRLEAELAVGWRPSRRSPSRVTAGGLQARSQPEGSRNEWLTRFAGHYARRHAVRDDYLEKVRSANANSIQWRPSL